MEWIAAGGMALQGVGGIISAFNQPDYPAELSPEAQYDLAQQGIDLNKFQANLAAVQQAYSNSVLQYQLSKDPALQEAYNKYYGGAEEGMADYAKSAFSGELSPGAKQLGVNLGIDAGKSIQSERNRILENAAQRGIPADSPIVLDELRKAESQIQSAYLGGKSNIGIQDYFQGIQNSMGIVNAARSAPRLAGVDIPAPPMTPQQEAVARQNAAMETRATNIDDVARRTAGVNPARARAMANLAPIPTVPYASPGVPQIGNNNYLSAPPVGMTGAPPMPSTPYASNYANPAYKGYGGVYAKSGSAYEDPYLRTRS